MRPILSVVWVGGSLGGACYDPETLKLSILPDIADSQPDFEVLKLLVRQADPAVVIASNRQDANFVSTLKSLSRQREETNEGTRRPGLNDSQLSDSNNSSVAMGPPPPPPPLSADLLEEDEDGFDLLMLPGRDFAPDPCKARLQKQRLPDEPPELNDKEHVLYISSRVPFASNKMIRAAGALLLFLDKNSSSFGIGLADGRVPILDIVVCQMDDLVLVDDTTWKSLQIFNHEPHPARARYKRASKEGLSVYNLLNKCHTFQGTKFLRGMLSRPLRNTHLLARRYDVIEYCSNPRNLEFVKNVRDCLKGIKNMPALLSKLSLLNASSTEWRDLYNTLYQCVALTEIVGRQPQTIDLFMEICERERIAEMKILVEEMMRMVDFNETKNHGRFYPNAGVNAELDKARKQYTALPKIMTDLAAQEIRNLPDYVEQCCIVYLPEVGYLLAVNLWDDNLQEDELQLDGLEKEFSTANIGYYRSDRTRDLDTVLGDLLIGMLECETNIMVVLTEMILDQKKKLLEMSALVAELDCLMAIAGVSTEFSFVRPTILPSGEAVEIKDGRHPLLATISPFVSNSTTFVGDERIVLLTGPNASGKSVYLKQVGIIVLMALCGSFVPANAARIPLFDRVVTKINLTESISLGLSTFMLDLNQMAMAVRNTTRSSLIIVDEFGKGTADADGLGLLVACLEKFLSREEDCPTVFLSTHFYSVTEYLQASSRLKMQTMEFAHENDQTVYLYKLKDGVCQSSFAHVVARSAGIEESIVSRSLEMVEVIQKQLGEEEMPREEPTEKEALWIELGKELLGLDINEDNVEEYFERVRTRAAPFLAEDIPMEAEDEFSPTETDRLFAGSMTGESHNGRSYADTSLNDEEDNLHNESFNSLEDTLDYVCSSSQQGDITFQSGGDLWQGTAIVSPFASGGFPECSRTGSSFQSRVVPEGWGLGSLFQSRGLPVASDTESRFQSRGSWEGSGTASPSVSDFDSSRDGQDGMDETSVYFRRSFFQNDNSDEQE